jgi:hypothetical protein
MTNRWSPFDNADDEREWQAQQRAFEQTDRADDALVARYRDVARGLRALPRAELPSDFARKVAAQALGEETLLCTFEYAMLIALCVVFVVALGGIGFPALKDTSTVDWHWLYALLIGAAAAGLGMGRATRIA